MNYIYYNTSLKNTRKAVAKMAGIPEDRLQASSCYRELTDLSVDAVRDLCSWCDLSGRKYVLVAHAEDMAAEAANALLKTLEERENVTFFFNAKSHLMETIESRSRSVSSPKDRRDFEEYIRRTYPHEAERADLLWSFTQDEDVVDELLNGSPVYHLLFNLDSNFDTYMEDEKARLRLFGLLEEKNSGNFFDTQKKYVVNLFEFILERLLAGSVCDDCDRAEKRQEQFRLTAKHHRLIESGYPYAKSDFFEYLVCL